MLWQNIKNIKNINNIKNIRNILDRLVEKVGKLELKLHSERNASLKTHDRA
ncbi:hypothetical protein MADA3029_210018 [Vibrio nigripulchritudo MADA3029]|nr:hypothetical protein VIBNIMADA3020_480019 [Vibrio nigripulchritudo MADA3020]CCN55258.1 hypothetical protein VIBNIMADA3021_710018 [Vibrio nigripulchritudo MADA3021]CCN58628.1 hypothetical protein MADA3029_210018 [Vibrio nigripulchritudo MADA3029]